MTNLRYPNSQRIFQSITKLKTSKLKYGRYWLQTNPFWSEKKHMLSFNQTMYIRSKHTQSVKNPNFRSIQYKCRNQLTAKATEDFHFPGWVSKEDSDTIQEPISLKSQIGRFTETKAMIFYLFFFCVREREEDLKRSMKSNWNGKWKAIEWKRTS